MDRPDLTADIVLTLGIAGGALVLFVWNRIRADMVALIVMAVVILTGLVTPREGTSGFSNEATATVALMMVLAAGLVRTGAIDLLGAGINRLAGDSELRFLIVLMIIVVPASAFINNTPVVIVMLPIVLGFARRTGMAASRLLMPVSFGSQLGGTLTLIGTSTNLLVAAIIVDLGLPRFRLFDITPAALVLAVIGLVYLLTIGRALVPDRKTATSYVKRYELRDYLTTVRVGADAPIVDKTLGELRFQQRYGLQVVAVRRGGERIRFPHGATRLQADDVLLLEGKIEDIAKLENTASLRIAGTRAALLEEPGVEHDLAEILVPPRSRTIGRTVRQLGFRARYGLNVLAMQRHAAPVHAALGAIPLEAGDILLVQGPQRALQRLHRGGEFALLGSVGLPARRLRRLRVSVAITAVVVLLAAFDVLSIMVASLLGAIAMVLSGCLRPDEAYRDMDWMVLVLLGGVIPLGVAMQNTGTAAFIAGGIMQVVQPIGPIGALGAFYILTSLLTQLISNNAAAIVLTPIAVAVAAGLGVSPVPFVVATMFAASNSFMTPIGYQTNAFIYGPGGYTFGDYLRVGGPLTFLLALAAAFVIPFFFPF